METRYISLEAAIDAVMSQTCWRYNNTTIDERGIISNLRNTAAADVVPAPRWIPVKERPPEEFQKVLVFWNEHSEPMIDTAFWQKEAKRFDCEHWVRMEDKVTHWMPLPEPPKEGGTEDA